eukprot:CAMPEP_0175493516 /NCGR_PEP_ID=MMETSP0096-20121207/2811_1 /TAXON_ID=311494 /ORGANISM="Alexandrium monilatum, Strain CCMP3105" /LENGTH=40 /DNA_ID= /DNA_START= /DNA_END= /DNA_ORIENTATION=
MEHLKAVRPNQAHRRRRVPVPGRSLRSLDGSEYRCKTLHV